jgi:copper chaperone NosL
VDFLVGEFQNTVIFKKIQCSPYFNSFGVSVEKERPKQDFRESKTEEGIGMKRGRPFVLVMAFCLFTETIVLAQGQEDIQKHPSCKYCGMDREKFGHSRMLVEYEDGTSLGTCSLHCMAVELAIHIDKTPKTILVGDFHEKKLLDVEKASWVIGGNKMGVMTKRAKWAFGKKEDAEKFKAENGGDVASFEQAIKASYEDMYADTKMIRERRRMRKMEHKHN